VNLLEWDIYEVSTEISTLTGRMLRGTIRKFALENNINLLVENTQDVSGKIRIAILSGTNIDVVEKFLSGMISDSKLELKMEKVKNPILAKLKCNIESRYN
jgi:hypothetical protein